MCVCECVSYGRKSKHAHWVKKKKKKIVIYIHIYIYIIVIWSVKAKKVFAIELTVAFEKFSTGHISVSWKNMKICENNESENAG